MGEKLSAAQREQCHATVWDRDTYRYTGRGAHGFELHFKPRQCRRFAKANGLCHQHQHNYPEYGPTGRYGAGLGAARRALDAAGE
jgi:hypothetical protein